MTQTEKICTGCGRSSLNPIGEQHLACCPDNNYVTMSNNKNSVDWFLDELLKNGYIKRLPVIEFQQAKAMHKEEHSKTWDDSVDNYLERGKNVVRHWSDFDEYYNETYK